MSSAVSTVIGNHEDSEYQALQSCYKNCKPRVWERYFPTSHTQQINTQQPSIRFTIRLSTMTGNANGRICTSVYRKPIHLDQYLENESYHPQAIKCGKVKRLYRRVSCIVPPH